MYVRRGLDAARFSQSTYGGFHVPGGKPGSVRQRLSSRTQPVDGLGSLAMLFDRLGGWFDRTVRKEVGAEVDDLGKRANALEQQGCDARNVLGLRAVRVRHPLGQQ